MKGNSFSDIVILAGGIGERLWPASRPDNPKQFMKLNDGTSFLQASIIRGLSLNPLGKILIITRADILKQTCDQCAELKSILSEDEWKKLEQDLCIVAEPVARHTTAPILLACRYIRATGRNDGTVLVLASDHVISPIESFVSDCQKAAELAEKGSFVCFSIPPTEASTGYGYIKQGEILDGDSSCFKIAQFKEKPEAKTAREYLESGQYFWNSGMFGFTCSFFERELSVLEPEVTRAFEVFDDAAYPQSKTLEGIQYIDDWEPMLKAYQTVPAIAVDNAVAEKTKHSASVKASFDWDDVGSWDAFEKHFCRNEGEVASENSNNNFVYSDIPVALCGVDDLIVVIKNGKALVMKKSSSNLMRNLVKKVRENSGNP